MHFPYFEKTFSLVLFLLFFCSTQNYITAQSSYETTVIGATEITIEYKGETPRLDEYVVDPTIVHPVTKVTPEGYHPKDDWPLHPKTNPNALPIGADPVWQQNHPSGTISPLSPQGPSFLPDGVNFEGLSQTGFAPGDPSMDVGPNHVIQMTNGQSGGILGIWDKSGNALHSGAYIQYDTALGDGWNGAGDPIVLYDHTADRWLLTEFQSSGFGNALYLAISTTDDPLGTYYTYTVNTPNFPDYPHYSMWQVSPEQSMYLITTNESACGFYVLDRAAMLNGDETSAQRFETPDVGLGFLAGAPVHWDSPMTPPPSGQNPMAMRMKDDGWWGVDQDALEFWELEIDFFDSGNSSLSLVQELSVSPFESELCGYTNWACIEQPDGGQPLDPLLEVLMNRVQYRNFGTHESIVCCHTTDVDGNDRAGIRWYELRRTDGDWSVYQEGTYSPDNAGRFMGTIAMDDDGNIALGFNISSTTIYPSIRYTGRDASSPLGQMTWEETSIKEGTGTHWSSRYGDYNQMAWDPASSSFWMTAMYNDADDWKTRVAQLSPASVTAGGCMEVTACNYDEDAEEDDGSCTFADEGFDCDGNCLLDIDACGVCGGDGTSCSGCTYETYTGFITLAGNESEEFIISAIGILTTIEVELGFFNNDGNAYPGDMVMSVQNGESGPCVEIGGYDVWFNCADNDGNWPGDWDNTTNTGVYSATWELSTPMEITESLVLAIGNGWSGSYAVDYELALSFVGICEPEPEIEGCTDAVACNYDATATDDDGSCFYPNNACDDGNPYTSNDMYTPDCQCVGDPNPPACTDSDACNYDPTAYTDDGSCVYIGEACNDYDPNTSGDVWGADCTCAGVVVVVTGCTDEAACNYDDTATDDDDSCTYPTCNDPLACNYDECSDPLSVCYDADGCFGASPCTYAVGWIPGCTYIDAINHDPNATVDDGSCTFSTSGDSDCATFECPDLNGDGVVNVTDVLAVLAAFGEVCVSAQ